MKINLLVICVFIFTGFVNAQTEKDTPYKYWIEMGFFLEARSVTANIAYSFSIGENFYKAGYMIKGGDPIFGGYGTDIFKIKSINASIGKRYHSNWFHSSFFIGPSYIFGTKLLGTHISGPIPEESFHTVGLDAEIQLLFRPANEIGIGIGLYGGLNFAKNYSGVKINLNFGNGK